MSAVEPAAWERVLAERCAIAARLGPLLVAFAGEHVGEPRLLVCLYGRGELLEAADALALIRGLALGPLALASRGARPSGARKIEQVAPDVAPRFHRTVAASDLRSSLAALAHPGRCRNEAAEAAAVAYARDVEARVG